MEIRKCGKCGKSPVAKDIEIFPDGATEGERGIQFSVIRCKCGMEATSPSPEGALIAWNLCCAIAESGDA